VGVENIEENRRKYRQMLFTAHGCDKYLCGAILDPETLDQKSDTGSLFPDLLNSKGIIPGVKPHLKTYVLPGTIGDTVMQGLDSLADRLKTYYAKGARFTKWRAPFDVDVATGRPTRFAIESNMNDLARFALISQAEGMVPLVEPDVMMKGTHTLEQAVYINTQIQSTLYRAMLEAGVYMEVHLFKIMRYMYYKEFISMNMFMFIYILFAYIYTHVYLYVYKLVYMHINTYIFMHIHK
jgi:fructose-bisphosphate aldolase class I